jgi:hypothetical protein
MPCHWATIRFVQELLFIVIFFIILAPLGFPAYPKFRKDFLIAYT